MPTSPRCRFPRRSGKNVRVELAPGYSISRIIKGGWQLAAGHGVTPSDAQAHADMAAFVEAGVTTFDCADIYTGVEELIGSFAPPFGRSVQVHTKYVPDLLSLDTVDAADTGAIIDRSRSRLRREALDLVQFHWWDYRVRRYVEVARHLDAASPRWRHPPHRRHELRHRNAARDPRRGCARDLPSGSVLASRPPPRRGHERSAPPSGVSSSSATALCSAVFSPNAGWVRPNPRSPSRIVHSRSTGSSSRTRSAGRASSRCFDLSRRSRTNTGVTIGAIGIAWVLAQPHVAAAIVGARNADHLARDARRPQGPPRRRRPRPAWRMLRSRNRRRRLRTRTRPRRPPRPDHEIRPEQGVGARCACPRDRPPQVSGRPQAAPTTQNRARNFPRTALNSSGVSIDGR